MSSRRVVEKPTSAFIPLMDVFADFARRFSCQTPLNEVSVKYSGQHSSHFQKGSA